MLVGAALAKAQMRVQQARANERIADLPRWRIEQLRAARFPLSLDAAGPLCASPTEPLDQVWGVGLYRERETEFAGILRGEAKAAAAQAEAARAAV